MLKWSCQETGIGCGLHLITIKNIRVFIFLSLAIAVFWIGIYPESFLLEFREDVVHMVDNFNNKVLLINN